MITTMLTQYIVMTAVMEITVLLYPVIHDLYKSSSDDDDDCTDLPKDGKGRTEDNCMDE